VSISSSLKLSLLFLRVQGLDDVVVADVVKLG